MTHSADAAARGDGQAVPQADAVPPASSAHIRTLLDQEPEAVAIVDVRTLRYVDVNEAFCTLLGYSRPDMLAQEATHIGQYLNMPAQAMRDHYDGLVKRAPTPFEGSTTFGRADGSTVNVDVWRRAFQLDGRWCVITRANEARAGRAALVTQRTDLQRVYSLMASSSRAITLTDYETMKFLQVNDAACRVLGYTRERMFEIGPGPTLGFTPELMAVQSAKLVMISPQLFAEDLTIPHGTRGSIDVLLTSYAFMADDRWVIFSWLRDMTRQREAERELRRLSLAIDQAADSVVLIDADTCEYLYANATAYSILGYTHEEYMKLKPWEIDARVGDPAAIRERYQSLVRQSPQVQQSEGALYRRDGTVIPMEYSRSALELDGRWVVLVAGRDITERKKAEAELKRHVEDLTRSNQELERFAYVASHDLSEPLRMVASYTQLLERRYGPQLDDEAREFIGFAVDGARRMKRLIDDLLTYSRAGRADKPMREVDMNVALADALKNLQQLIAEKGATIERGELPVVRGDATALVQLLQNLVGNALKFVKDRPPVVKVSASEGTGAGAGEWTVRVQDNGVGIEPQYFNRIFELFQRLHTQDKFQGTGLGLAICKKIVERHGGRIWVESVPGEGSTFSFSIPKADGAAPDGARGRA